MSFFEGPTQKRDFLAADGVEQRADNLASETRFLVVVHDDDLLPVPRHFRQPEVVAQVDQVQDVFLETGSAETDGGFQELGTYTRVGANGVGDFFYIRAGGFAQGRDGINAADALGEEGVGRELRQLRRPYIRGDDALARDPGVVHLYQGVDGGLAGVGLLSPNEHPIRFEQVTHSGTLGQEFRIGEDLEVEVPTGRVEDGF